MIEKFDLQAEQLRTALRTTFEHRGTPLPAGPTPRPLTPEFADLKEAQWKQFLARNGLSEPDQSFAKLLERLRTFVERVLG